MVYWQTRTGKICALKSTELEIPSAYVRVFWTGIDRAEVWKLQLAKELKVAGYNVDMNKVI